VQCSAVQWYKFWNINKKLMAPGQTKFHIRDRVYLFCHILVG
jgi:hypothetical protein